MATQEHGTALIPAWQRGIWTWVSAGLGITGLLLLAIVGYMVARISELIADRSTTDLSFAFSGMTLLILTMLRLLAILVGAGMIFGGLAVSFHTHAEATKLEGDAVNRVKASLATSSPGLAAIVVGAVVILAALFSKGEYRYEPPAYQLVSAEEYARMTGQVVEAVPADVTSDATKTASAPVGAASRPFRSASEIIGSFKEKK